MQGRTSLQEHINQSGIVEKLVGNLCDVRDHMGIHAFNFFIDKEDAVSKVSGRLYYTVDMAHDHPKRGQATDTVMKLRNSELMVDGRTAEHVVGRFEACGGSTADINIITGEIGQMLNNDPRFQELMQQFEAEFPGKGDVLRDFAVSQGAYRVLDKCAEVCTQNRTAPIMQEMKEIEAKIKTLQEGSRNDKKKVPELEEQHQELMNQYKEEGNVIKKVLGTARQSILGYKHEYDRGACEKQDRTYMEDRIARESSMSSWDVASKKNPPRKFHSDPTPAGSKKEPEMRGRSNSFSSTGSITDKLSPPSRDEGSPSLKQRLSGLWQKRKQSSEKIHNDPYASEKESSEESLQAFPGVQQFDQEKKPEGLEDDGNKQEAASRSPGMRGGGDLK